jgi:hypothetical protein
MSEVWFSWFAFVSGGMVVIGEQRTLFEIEHDGSTVLGMNVQAYSLCIAPHLNSRGLYHVQIGPTSNPNHSRPLMCTVSAKKGTVRWKQAVRSLQQKWR